jgi:hypothetical protein
MPHVHGEVGHHHVYDDAWFAEWQADYEFTMKVQAELMELSVEEIINHA